VAETTVKRLLCCRFRRTVKAMGHVYQCCWRICREKNFIFPGSNIIFYVLYPIVSYLLTLPRMLKIDILFVIHPPFFSGMCVELEYRLGEGGSIMGLARGRLTGYWRPVAVTSATETLLSDSVPCFLTFQTLKCNLFKPRVWCQFRQYNKFSCNSPSAFKGRVI
jgi:hypothetical protein